MDYLANAAQTRWLGLYLRILAIIFAYGCLVHGGNIAGLGETPWLETPLSWRIGDIVYGLLNIVCVVGLWRHKAWGIVAMLAAIASQFFLYTLFTDVFASNAEQRDLLYSLLGTEAVIVIVFVGLLGGYEIQRRKLSQNQG